MVFQYFLGDLLPVNASAISTAQSHHLEVSSSHTARTGILSKKTNGCFNHFYLLVQVFYSSAITISIIALFRIFCKSYIQNSAVYILQFQATTTIIFSEATPTCSGASTRHSAKIYIYSSRILEIFMET